MVVEKELRIIEGHHPRRNEWSVLRPDYRLRIAYNVVVDEEKRRASKVPVNERLMLVFSHGNGMNKECWDYHIQKLFDRHGDILDKVVAIDSVNQNDSHVLNEGKLGWLSHWADCAKDIIKIVNAEQTGAINILVGHSMGGTQCIYAGAFEPSLFDSMVVCDPVVQGLLPEDTGGDVEAAHQLAAARFAKIGKSLRNTFKGKDEYENYIKRRSLSRTFITEIQHNYMEGAAIYHKDGTISVKTPADQQMVTYYSTPYAFRDALKYASLLDCEVVHIAGTTPTVTTWRSSEDCRKALRYCTAVDIEDAGHNVPFEQPDQTTDAISAFITRRRERAIELAKDANDRKYLSKADREKLLAEKYQETIDTYPAHKIYAKI